LKKNATNITTAVFIGYTLPVVAICHKSWGGEGGPVLSRSFNPPFLPSLLWTL